MSKLRAHDPGEQPGIVGSGERQNAPSHVAYQISLAATLASDFAGQSPRDLVHSLFVLDLARLDQTRTTIEHANLHAAVASCRAAILRAA